MEYKNFGDFIKCKREAQMLTLRGFAEQLDVSAPYLSDVEKNRRNAFDIDRLNLAARLLFLTKDEKEQMLNLAGLTRNTVAPDLPEYIIEHDYVSTALRTARDLGAREEDWLKFVDDLKKRKS